MYYLITEPAAQLIRGFPADGVVLWFPFSFQSIVCIEIVGTTGIVRDNVLLQLRDRTVMI